MNGKCDLKLEEKSTIWHYWCRLCSKNNAEPKIRSYFVNVEKLVYSKKTRIKDAMLRYFDINIAEYEEIPTYLCRECYSLLASLMQFTEVVNNAQIMFKYLYKEGANIERENLESVREENGFFDESKLFFKDLLDGFELEFEKIPEDDFELEFEIIPKENYLDIIEPKLSTCSNESTTNNDTKTCESESESSSYDGFKDSEYENSSNIAEENAYICGTCSKDFKNLRTYCAHWRSEHQTLKYQKALCKKKKLYICGLCSKNFQLVGEYRAHWKTDHPNEKYQQALSKKVKNVPPCPYCAENFKTFA